MSRILRLLLIALAVFAAACGGQASTPSSAAPTGTAPVASGSPSAPTPTAQIAEPAQAASPSPSPLALVSSPAGASPQPNVIANPVSNPVPGEAVGAAGVLFRIVPEQSEAMYVAREKFVERPAPNEAIGRTKDVSGEIALEQPGVLRGRVLNVRVDLRTLTSDSSRRDAYVRQNTLQTEQFPYAEFSSDEVVGPESYSEGDEVQFQVPGTMTIRDQARPLTWDVQAKLIGEVLTGSAVSRIKLTDFAIDPPRLAILTVDDEMRWEIRFTARESQ